LCPKKSRKEIAEKKDRTRSILQENYEMIITNTPNTTNNPRLDEILLTLLVHLNLQMRDLSEALAPD
jgi:hypothetical protein